MPMPTRVYKVLIVPYTMEESGHEPDVAVVNDLASQGYVVNQMLTIGGGTQPGAFVYLMDRTVTNLAETTDG